MDSAYGSDKKPEPLVTGSSLVPAFQEERSFSSCSDVSAASTIKRPDSINYESVLRSIL